ncbi:MAG: PaaI family thioesterase [Acidobacteriota bacterium]
MKKLKDDNNCFVCGTDNPTGLRFKFEDNNEGVISRISFPERFQGWEGIVHGGIISTAIDEVMVKAAAKERIRCVTAEINVRFKKPCYTGHKYVLSGKIVENNNKILKAEGKITDSKNRTIAEGSGKLFVIKGDIAGK